MKNKKEFKGMQGDVQFATLKSLPKGAVKIKNRPIAYGEISGHCHVLTGDVDLFEIEGRIIAVIGHDGARLQHIHESKLTKKSWVTTKEIEKADHHSHLLTPDTIVEFWIQNNYNPYKKLMEVVKD